MVVALVVVVVVVFLDVVHRQPHRLCQLPQALDALLSVLSPHVYTLDLCAYFVDNRDAVFGLSVENGTGICHNEYLKLPGVGE